MADCSLPRRNAKENAKNYLIQKGVIDRFSNIIDEKSIVSAMSLFREHALKEYGFRADFIKYDTTQGSSKVFLNGNAFHAVDILKGIDKNPIMSLETQRYINEATNFEPAQAPAFSASFYDTAQNQSATEAPTQGLTRVVTLKTDLLRRANERLTKIKPLLKENKDNPAKYNELLKLQSTLKDYIDGNEVKGIKGLVAEIEELKNIDSRAPEIIAPFVLKELERLDTLSKSTDSDQLKEAKEIINFVKSMADFNHARISQSPLGHPIYHIKELYDADKNFLLTDGMVEPYKQWARIAEGYEDKLAAGEIQVIEKIYNASTKIKDLFGDKTFTYADIISSGQGLKDINAVDMMVMDISSGIFSSNGLMPQVIRNLVDNAFEKEAAWTKEIQEKIDNLTPGVITELKKMGYNLTSLGILGIDGVNYDLFKQMIPNSTNQSSGNIVHKYSYQYFEDRTEMNSQFNRAMDRARKIEDDNLKRIEFKKAVDFKNAWYKNNTQILNPAMLSSIVSDPKFASLAEYFTATPEQMQAHEDLLVSIAGRDYVNKMIDSQSNKLNTYMIQRENTLTGILAEDNVTNIADLTPRGQKAFEIWEAEHNPFHGVTYREEPIGNGGSRIGNSVYHAKFEFNESIPNTANYYDKNYATIESNPTLKAFYDVVFDATSGMRDRFPSDIQKKMLDTSVPFLKRSMMEIMTDENLSFFQALSKVFRQMWDNIKEMFGINAENSMSAATVNPTTGLPEYKINDSFIKQNSDKINDLFLIKAVNFSSFLKGIGGFEVSGRLEKYNSIALNAMNDQVITELSTKYMGKSMTRDELWNQFGDSIPVGKILIRSSQHEVAQEKSFDLPKVIKNYSALAAKYSARQDMLPLIELMKDHYTQIKNQSTNNLSEAIVNAKTGDTRMEGLRTQANKQFNNWFKRVVIGEYGLSKHYGVWKAAVKLSPVEEQAYMQQYIGTAMGNKRLDGKIYSIQEKKLLIEIDKAIVSSDDPSDLEKLTNLKNNLGKEIAASAAVESIFSFLRFKGLGFNLSSGITNFIEGQVSNSIVASSGVYFNPEFIYEVSPSEMIAGDMIKQRTPSLMPEKIAKAEFLSKATDVLQDNTNELQKASSKTAFSALKRLNPFYFTAKGEQYNQIPLMVATMKAHPIIAIDGSVSNVWDALRGEFLPDSKQWTVKLKPEFLTQENKAAWEDYNGQSYFDWKSKIRQVIANTHGDFSETGGMMAKSFQAGRAALMFKTWLPREFYKRFATEQDDLLAGVKGFKGRWRSHTPTTGAAFGGIMGSFFLGPVGAVLGAGAGGILAAKYGARTNINVLQELALTSKLLTRKLIGMPLNLAGSLVGKNRLINTQLNNNEFDRLQNPNFTQQDFNNLRGNMQDLAMMLTWFGLLLLTKAFLWDDEDEEDSDRRKAHNLLANRFMQLGSQGMMFANTTEQAKILVPPIFKFGTDVGLAISSLSQLVEGDDILMAGSNAGESRSFNQMKKTFLPGIIADPSSVGMGKSMERQFTPWHFDSYFWGDEKNAQREIKRTKAERRQELEDQDLEQNQIDQIIKDEFPRRAKGQTYKELLESITDE